MSNGQPHVHTAELNRDFGDSGAWFIAYGDTRVYLYSPFISNVTWSPTNPSQKRIDRAIVKAVKRHDASSRKYEAKRIKGALPGTQYRVTAAFGKWPSEKDSGLEISRTQ